MADKKLGFAESFMLSGVAAGVSKTAAAPIETKPKKDIKKALKFVYSYAKKE